MNTKGLSFVASAGIAWGTGGVVASILYSTSGLGPIAVSTWRVVLAALILALFATRSTPSTGMRPILLTGAALAVYQTAYYGAVAHAGVAIGTVVTLGACPVLTALGERVLRGRRIPTVSVLTAVAGVTLLTAGNGVSGPNPSLGIALALLSAAGYTAVTLGAGSIDRSHATQAKLFVVATICLVPLAFHEGPVLPDSAASWAWIAYLGVIPTVVAYRLYFAGLALVSATTAAIVILIEPLTAAAIAVIWLDERLTITAVLGGVLILTAAGTIASRRREEPATKVMLEVDMSQSEFEQWRTQREARLRNPYGWLSLVGLHWLSAEPSTFDGVPGVWRAVEGGAVVVAEPTDRLTVDGQPLHGEQKVAAEQRVRQGELEIQVIDRGGALALRVRDPQSPLLTEFAGVPAYPYAEKWVLPGRFTSEHTAMSVGSVVPGLHHDVALSGFVEFEVDGVTHRLTTFDDGDGEVSVLFRDATSGKTTYPASRSLDLGVPGPDGAVTVDFNRAYNMPCAFTDFGTCALPPRENVLSIAIEAGEKDPR